jgi:hypothetical protein
LTFEHDKTLGIVAGKLIGLSGRCKEQPSPCHQHARDSVFKSCLGASTICQGPISSLSEDRHRASAGLGLLAEKLTEPAKKAFWLGLPHKELNQRRAAVKRGATSIPPVLTELRSSDLTATAGAG